jgi:hypothetical protein
MVDLDLSDLPFILEESHQLLDFVVVFWDIFDKDAIFSFSLRTSLLIIHFVVVLRIVHRCLRIRMTGRRWREIHFTFRAWRWWGRNEIFPSKQQRSGKDRL